MRTRGSEIVGSGTTDDSHFELPLAATPEALASFDSDGDGVDEIAAVEAGGSGYLLGCDEAIRYCAGRDVRSFRLLEPDALAPSGALLFDFLLVEALLQTSL